MFKKRLSLSLLNLFGAASTASGSTSENQTDDMVLGTSCPIPSSSDRVIMDKRKEERRARPRCVQHTPNARAAPKIYIDNGDGYVNKDDSTDKISYEEAKAIQAMPRPDIEEARCTELPVFQKMRTQAMMMKTVR